MWLAVTLLIITAATTAAEDATCSKPLISVPGAVRDSYGYNNVRNSQDIEMYCSSNTNQLEIQSSFELQTQTFNETTVKAVIPANLTRDQLNYFTCKINGCDGVVEWLKFDYYPKITGFSCYSKNIELLNCTIATQLNDGNYTLSLMGANGVSAILCVNYLRYLKQYSCVWDMSNIAHGKFLFLTDPHVVLRLKICSFLDCVIKDYDLDIMAVTKLNAPNILNVSISTDNAVLQWMPYHGPLVKVELYYEVEYGLSGIPTTEIISNSTKVLRGGKLKLGLKLPCPERQYSVRVSCRPVNASSIYMSDSSYITFDSPNDYNAPDNETALNPICLIEPIDENPTVMIYKIKKLKKFIRQELGEFEKRKSALKNKSEGINKELKHHI